MRLGEEFHHNGLTIRCAQIGRVPRGLSHTWSRHRLACETIELLRAFGPAIREHLITDIIPYDDGPTFMTRLARAYDPTVLQAVLAVRPGRANVRERALQQQEPHPRLVEPAREVAYA